MSTVIVTHTPNVHASWRPTLTPVFNGPTGEALRALLRNERAQGNTVYPPMPEIFEALNRTPLHAVKAVIIGQDPYHQPGQAHGLSFSVRPGVTVPPSLVNIYKELETDLGIPPASHGYLSAWADRGVLLLNSSLTVRARQAGSHRMQGWEAVTDAIIQAVSHTAPPSAFILWGRHAQEKGAHIDRERHLVIESSHPSPMGGACFRGFFGSRPFSRTNTFLESHGREPIDWTLPA